MTSMTHHNFQPVLDEIVAALRPQLGQGGTVASYIPALARVPVEQFGIALRTRDGVEASAGDAATPFSIQSISKLFTLTLAMRCIASVSVNSFDTLWIEKGVSKSPAPASSPWQVRSAMPNCRASTRASAGM